MTAEAHPISWAIRGGRETGSEAWQQFLCGLRYTSSVITLNSARRLGPKLVDKATSVASRP